MSSSVRVVRLMDTEADSQRTLRVRIEHENLLSLPSQTNAEAYGRRGFACSPFHGSCAVNGCHLDQSSPKEFLSLMKHPAFSGGFFVSFSLGKRMKKNNDKP